jgi:hypothetical protein
VKRTCRYKLLLAGIVAVYLSYKGVKDVSASESLPLIDHFGVGGPYGIGSGLIFVLVIIFVVGIFIYVNQGRK